MKKLIALFFVVILVVSSMGFTIGTHYCGGKAVKTELMLVQRNMSCGMAEQTKPCIHHAKHIHLEPNSCCQNKFFQITIEEDYNAPLSFELPEETFCINYLLLPYINNYSFLFIAEQLYKDYSPPLLDADIPVLIQSFLV